MCVFICVCVCHSGAYRPVGAESGEYLYCPPQRWLNNLHVSLKRQTRLPSHSDRLSLSAQYAFNTDECWKLKTLLLYVVVSFHVK